MVKQIEIDQLDEKVRGFLREIESEHGASITEQGRPLYEIIAAQPGREVAREDFKEIVERVWARTRSLNLTEQEVDDIVAEATCLMKKAKY